jgi:hypothetical protein
MVQLPSESHFQEIPLCREDRGRRKRNPSREMVCQRRTFLYFIRALFDEQRPGCTNREDTVAFREA